MRARLLLFWTVGILTLLPGQLAQALGSEGNLFTCLSVTDQNAGLLLGATGLDPREVRVIRGLGVHQGALKTGYFLVMKDQAWFFPMSEVDAKLALDRFQMRFYLSLRGEALPRILRAMHIPSNGGNSIVVSRDEKKWVSPRNSAGGEPMVLEFEVRNRADGMVHLVQALREELRRRINELPIRSVDLTPEKRRSICQTLATRCRGLGREIDEWVSQAQGLLMCLPEGP